MTAVDRVFAAFGGQAATAKALGFTPQRVYAWKKSGAVPAGLQAQILRVAKEKKVKLKPVDLVNLD